MNKSVYINALQEITLTFRALTEDDAEAYRALRLKALETEGHWFTADLEKERSQTRSEWKAACSETIEHVTLAAFLGDQLVGTTAVEAYEDHIAKWKSTYIEPSLRHASVAETLFEMCIDWCKQKGFTEAVFTIRTDNMRSRAIQEGNGAIKTGEEPMRFADGSIAPVYWYKKQLTA